MVLNDINIHWNMTELHSKCPRYGWTLNICNMFATRLSVSISKDTGKHLRFWEWNRKSRKKNPKLQVSGALCALARPALWELNVWGSADEPDSSTQTAALSLGGEEWKEGNSLFSWSQSIRAHLTPRSPCPPAGRTGGGQGCLGTQVRQEVKVR